MNENNTVTYNYYGASVEVTDEIKNYLEDNDREMNKTLVKRKLPSCYTKDKKLIHLKPLETYMSNLEALNIQIPDRDSGNIDYQDLKFVIAEVLDKLDLEERYIIEMTYFYNTREREIAADLNISNSTVYRRKTKALEKLKMLLNNKNPLE